MQAPFPPAARPPQKAKSKAAVWYGVGDFASSRPEIPPIAPPPPTATCLLFLPKLCFRNRNEGRSPSLWFGFDVIGRSGTGDVETAVKKNGATVHPTAVIHPNAVLGEEVTVGPFCTIGAGAKIGNASQIYPGSHIFGDSEIGEHCVIMAGAVIGSEIPGKTIIGNNNFIGHHAVVGAKCKDKKYKPGDPSFLFVGNNNDIREYVSIHRSCKSDDKTTIGDDNLIMGSCHIGHDSKVGDNNIFANSTLLAGHVIVEDNIHTAGAVVIHQFCQLGSFCFIGAGSMISQDVPKYMMISGDRAELRGLNFEGLKRYGFLESEIRSMRKAYRKIFMHVSPNLSCFEDRLAEVEGDPELSSCASVLSMTQSIRDSFRPNRRGICKFEHWSSHQQGVVCAAAEESDVRNGCGLLGANPGGPMSGDNIHRQQ